MKSPQQLSQQELAQLSSSRLFEEVAALINQEASPLSPNKIQNLYEQLKKFTQALEDLYENTYKSPKSLEDAIKKALETNPPNQEFSELIKQALNSVKSEVLKTKELFDQGIEETQNAVISSIGQILSCEQFTQKAIESKLNQLQQIIDSNSQVPLSSAESNKEREAIIKLYESMPTTQEMSEKIRAIAQQINKEFYLGTNYRQESEIQKFLETYLKPKTLAAPQEAKVKVLSVEEIATIEAQKAAHRETVKAQEAQQAASKPKKEPKLKEVKPKKSPEKNKFLNINSFISGAILMLLANTAYKFLSPATTKTNTTPALSKRINSNPISTINWGKILNELNEKLEKATSKTAILEETFQKLEEKSPQTVFTDVQQEIKNRAEKVLQEIRKKYWNDIISSIRGTNMDSETKYESNLIGAINDILRKKNIPFKLVVVPTKEDLRTVTVQIYRY
jgi:hypothetical protein